MNFNECVLKKEIIQTVRAKRANRVLNDFRCKGRKVDSLIQICQKLFSLSFMEKAIIVNEKLSHRMLVILVDAITQALRLKYCKEGETTTSNLKKYRRGGFDFHLLKTR